MCRPTTCRTCGLITWAGCGRHVSQVMAHVPTDARCSGHADAERPSLVGRIFGRRPS